MKNLFFDFKNELELRPGRAFLFMIATNVGFFLFFVFVMSNWPDYAAKILNVVSWIWLAWMVYVVVPTILYITKLGKD